MPSPSFAGTCPPRWWCEGRGVLVHTLTSTHAARADIAKAFATLEGIGLAADASYSIINETLPYISQVGDGCSLVPSDDL